ncbi:S-layer homology domain-containing protein [Demequina sp. NBRC 110056]|uniref:S-layer homology domain-containing protein n=1 Tax=Demequina sp. NBRC 110056 TaxID=1570345 RepID=UPI000A06D903|nr:S-layer homology domain-containing protein [Demequina sp. NBRC 110056]
MVSAGSAVAEDGGSISGTVHLPAAAPEAWLEAVWIHVYDADYAYYETASVGPDGSYVLDDVPAGDYYVNAQVDSYWDLDEDASVTPNLLDEFHDGEWFEADASTLAVDASAVSGVDFQLEAGATISGSVAIEEGASAELASERVEVRAEYQAGSRWHYATAWLDVAGDYSITGLYPVPYVVQFEGAYGDSGKTNVVTEYYNDALRRDDAVELDLSEGDVTGIDAILAEGRSISGVVSLPEGASEEWLRGVYVDVYDVDGNFFGSQTFDEVTGAYEVSGLPAGEFLVHAHAGMYWNDENEEIRPNLLSEFYDGAHSRWDAEMVSTASGSRTDIDIALDLGRTISGQVRLAEGSDTSLEEQQIYVSVYDPEVGGGQGVYADPETGDYEISGLAVGSYVVTFQSYAGDEVSARVMTEYYDDARFEMDATLVDVAEGDRVGIDAELALGNTIAGTVTLPEGSPEWWMDYISISAVESDGWNAYYGRPDASGAYAISGLPDGEYTVRFEAYSYYDEYLGTDVSTGLLDEYWENASSEQDATPVTLAGSNASGIDATLEQGHSISGTVSLADGVSEEWLEGVEVSLEGVGVDVYRSTQVRADGSYSFGALPDGDYNLYFSEVGVWVEPGGGYARYGLIGEYFDDAYSYDDAELVTVAGDDVSGIDAVLSAGARISGHVELADGGDPTLLEQGVRVYASTADEESDVWSSGQATVDAESGDYTITGLLPGEYVVRFEGAWRWIEEGGYEYDVQTNVLTEYYDDAAYRSDAEIVDVTTEDATGIDAELQEGGSISGKITVEEGSDQTLVEQGLRVIAESYGDEFWDTADAEVDRETGEYTITGLSHADYTVRVVGDWNYNVDPPAPVNVVEEFYGGVYSRDEATEVPVDGAESGIDIEVAEGRTISGKVSVDDGGTMSALQGVYVDAMGEEMGRTYQGSLDRRTGDYTIVGLPQGSYIVQFSASEYYWDEEEGELPTRLYGEYYDDAATYDEADAVVVGSTDVAGIDAELASYSVGSLQVDLTHSGAEFPYDGSFCLFVEDTAGEYLDGICLEADVDLPWTFEDLPTGRDVVLSVQDDEGSWIARQYLGGSNLAGTGQQISLVENDTVEVTFPISQVGTLSGVLSYEDPDAVVGYGHADVLVYAEREAGVWEPVECSECGGEGDPRSTTVTNESGEYTATGLVPGDYKIAFRPYYGEEAYYEGAFGATTAFYGGDSLATATVVTLAANGALTGFDGVLPLVNGPDPVYESGDGRLTLEITPPAASSIVAGQQYAFEYEVRNDTGEPLAFAAPDSVAILFAFDYDGVWPTESDCTFMPAGFGDFDRSILEWEIPLSGAIEPGIVGTCTVTYTATADDVDFGGLWTALVQRSKAGLGWDQSQWAMITAPGVSTEPKVTGTAQVGKTVSVSPGFWGPTLGGAFTYQWKVGGTNVSGATGATYVPKAADAGKKVSVTMSLATLGVTKSSAGVTVAAAPKPDPEPEPTPDPKPTPKPKPTVKLSDVSSNPSSRNYTQFSTQIQWLASEGITTGWNMGNGTYEFRAKDAISREAMAAFLYRYAGSPKVNLPSRSPFTDVPRNSQFFKEIVWLSQQGISTGWNVGGGKKEFRPKDSITRDAMAAFLYRFAGKPSFSAPSRSPFTDTPRSSTQFYKEITWLSSTGISTGWNVGGGKKEFRPYDSITREAMAAFLYRYDRKF